MSEREALLNRVWSYSSVHQYADCPRGFFLQRIQKAPQAENAFAQYGSFMHELLEKHFKGILSPPEMLELYLTDYDARVKLPFPENKWVDMTASYYQDGHRFLRGFTGLSSKFRVLGVELEVKLDIGGYHTIGYIDLLLENIESGELTVVDHKSKKRFRSKREELDYRRQLLFYGIFVKHLFGRYPAFVDFNLFRSQTHVSAPFDERACAGVREWFVQTIETALADDLFEDKIARTCFQNFTNLKSFKKDDFFCNEICSVRKSCPRSKACRKPRKKKTSVPASEKAVISI